MNLLKSVKLLENGLFIPKHKILAFSDLHIGFSLNVTIPLNTYGLIKKTIENMIIQTKPKRIVICGDVKHEFSKTLKEEYVHIKDLILLIKPYNPIIIRGNHDNFLQNITQNSVKILDKFEIGKYCFIHGHKLMNTNKTIIMGHEHPYTKLRDELGFSKNFKCHLINDNMIILPSINPLTYGNEVHSKPLSPIIKNYNNLRIFISGMEFPNK